MFKRMGLIMLVLAVAIIAAGCTSSAPAAPPATSPEKQAAQNSTLEKAVLLDNLEGNYADIKAEIEAARYTPSPELTRSAVDKYIATVDSYMAALTDFNTASSRYRSFLDNSSSEYRQAADNETAADAKLADAGDLKKELGLINDWLAEYNVWSPVNATAGDRAKEILYFASLTDPLHQSTPEDGIRFFNQARPQFVTYLNESTTMISLTDSLITVMDNSTTKDSLTGFRNDVGSMNAWVRTNYNAMIDGYDDATKGRFGTQEKLN